MSAGVATRLAACFVVLAATMGLADGPRPGRNQFELRGEAVDIYWLPASGAALGKVLYAPGEAGWRGFAVDIARQIAAAGYDVYGMDTRQYLQTTQAGGAVPSARSVAADFRAIASWVRDKSSTGILLAGWSEGAGLATAAAAEENHDIFTGVIAIGLTDDNILAWHWSDVPAMIAKRVPKEPTFRSADTVGRVAPLPLFMIASSADEYVTVERTRALFAIAHEPKRLAVIAAGNHKFAGNTGEFYRSLKDALTWVLQTKK